MIVKIDKAEGEWLREGDPVLEIMQLNTLRAKCQMSARYHTMEMVNGKKATAIMSMPDGRIEKFSGKVVFAHPKVEAGNTFEVFVEIENRRDGNSWILQPGIRLHVEIHL
jgi:hypothetical protein